ncbi:MAG: hypothetical protein KKC20_02725 [Proteobacteria bacterium]|nr:hypothetical protein [Pseudomonadota bacterium]
MLKENSVKILTSHNPAPVLIAILAAVLIIFNPQTSFAQTPKNKTAVKTPVDKKAADSKAMDKTLHVISDQMIAQKDASMVEFIGNVKATREDAVILADSIKVFVHSAGTLKQEKNGLQKIIATGNVEYTAGERKAFADKAVYTTEDEILVLTGKAPRLVTGKSHVTGKKITLFRNEDRAMVESDGKTRVQAIFNPEDQNTEEDQKKESEKQAEKSDQKKGVDQ